jgi:hypothetical protein
MTAADASPSVIHGRIRWLAHSHGSSVNGTKLVAGKIGFQMAKNRISSIATK